MRSIDGIEEVSLEHKGWTLLHDVFFKALHEFARHSNRYSVGYPFTSGVTVCAALCVPEYEMDESTSASISTMTCPSPAHRN